MNREKRCKSKYVLLAMMLVAMFILPSCRTRLTNNSEVSNIRYDEDGFLTESYEMRREELGLSTAKQPILPDFGSDDSDDNDDFSEGESINYNPDDYQEDFPDTQTNTTTNTNTNTGVRRSYVGSGGSSSSGSSSSHSHRYTITFDANGGKIRVADREEESFKVYVKEGDELGKHFPDPHPTREGYEFTGWFTDRNGGSQILPDTEATAASKTLYAHWGTGKKEDNNNKTDNDNNKKEYNVTIKFNNGAADAKVSKKEGEIYKLPAPGERDGYKFTGWKIGDKIYQAGDEIKISSNMTIEAQWKKNKTTETKPAPEPQKEQTTKATEYKITFDTDGGNELGEITTSEKTYKLPKPERNGYDFICWTDGSKDYNAGQEISVNSNIKLTAKWNEQPATKWKKELDNAVDVADKKVGLDLGGDMSAVNGCKTSLISDENGSYDFVIQVTELKKVESTLNNLADTKDEEDNYKYEGKRIIVIGSNSKKDKYKLAYQIALMNIIHESGIPENEAIGELLGEDADEVVIGTTIVQHSE